ncbi:MAG: deoxyribodipyrimidine photo-lyase [Bryobacteraceae bacterium]|nr:deoxyribodipyrimidine photo-lyase [Bryobacteraceae bacterium]MDW8379403.1 deoxyribodipyrimidine photo-lyase [Bryobacterales bacterium]
MERVRYLNDRAPRSKARYVLYWSQMNRRVDCNHALSYAAEVANRCKLPLLVYEAITCSYPYANDRLHTFMLEAVPETERRLKAKGIGYVFYLRRRHQDANNQLYCLAQRAAAVITDDYPTFIARRHNQSVPSKLDIPYCVVDSSCIVPMSLLDKREYAAYTIRPKIHRLLPQYLKPAPEVRVDRPWEDKLPEFHTTVTEDNIAQLVASCEIDHSVKPSISFRGGRLMAEKHLQYFVENKLRRYAKERNEPSAHATSDLSPYLHFGQIHALEVALAVREWAIRHHLIADEFLEELIVRRELAFNFARHVENPESFDALPDWARTTIEKHDHDRRNYVYTREQFERAETHDPLWNATQKEMLLRGKVHGYYRMYWGKKIIEWSPSHEEALRTMIYLHDRYALDGRDPNTYTNILWCFGLHDRPWPERPVFGTLRYMSYDGMRRKTNVEAYLREIEHLATTGEDPFRIQ